MRTTITNNFSKMKKIIFTLSIFLSSHFTAQKLYIWCPPEQKVKPRTSFLDKVNMDVIIFDGRTIPNKVRDKCDSKTVTDDVANYIKKIYPSANINILSEEAYYKKAENDKVTIKVAISAYHAGFGTDITVGIGTVGGNFTLLTFPKGEWNALTAYYVQVFDFRNSGAKRLQTEITELESKSNMFGYKSAKSALYNTYQAANQKLGFFIDNALME